jgi:hypothetical protein
VLREGAGHGQGIGALHAKCLSPGAKPKKTKGSVLPGHVNDKQWWRKLSSGRLNDLSPAECDELSGRYA